MEYISTQSTFVGDGKCLFRDQVGYEVGVISLRTAFDQVEELKKSDLPSKNPYTPEEVCVKLRASFANWLVESMKYRGAWKSVAVVDRFQFHIVDGLPGAGKSYHCKKFFKDLVEQHLDSKKPATMFSKVAEVYDVFEETGFFEKIRSKDPYLMCYEMLVAIDYFKRIHSCMALSVRMEELGFQPTYKHVIIVDGGPQRANAFFSWQEGKDIAGFDEICHLWSELFREQTVSYLFACPWERRVEQLVCRAENKPIRQWEVESWGQDKEAMEKLEQAMKRNLGKLNKKGTDDVIRVVRVIEDEKLSFAEKAIRIFTTQVFESVIRDKVESFTSEVGWWRVAIKMGNDSRTRRECEMFIFNKSWPSVQFKDRLKIIQGAFHSRFSVGGASVVPQSDEHVSVTILRVIALNGGLFDDDLQWQFQNMDRNISLFSSSGYCGAWVAYANKEVNAVLSSLSLSDK